MWPFMQVEINRGRKKQYHLPYLSEYHHPDFYKVFKNDPLMLQAADVGFV